MPSRKPLTVVFAVVPQDASERQAAVDRILADPPVVHPMDRSVDPKMGVWSTDESCYRFIADRCSPGTRTLETGTGSSTVLLALLAAEHICCTAGQDEVDRVVEHCRSHAISTDTIRFEVGASHQTLPPLERAGIVRDLVLIDGGHGFPVPIVDWFYAAGMLRVGGALVIDDVHLPAVRVLQDFLDKDPRWTSLAQTPKWCAWRRESDHGLAEDWTEQPFYVDRPNLAQLVRRVPGKIRRELTQRSPRARRAGAAKSGISPSVGPTV